MRLILAFTWHGRGGYRKSKSSHVQFYMTCFSFFSDSYNKKLVILLNSLQSSESFTEFCRALSALIKCQIFGFIFCQQFLMVFQVISMVFL